MSAPAGDTRVAAVGPGPARAVPTGREVTDPLLSVRDLHVRFDEIHAVSGVTFEVARGEFFGIVGESGSGKSVTARAVIDLLPSHAQKRGQILFKGEDLLQARPKRLRAIRGSSIGFVFQDALAALDPVYTIGDQLVEALLAKRSMRRSAARRRAADLLDEVGIPDPRQRLDSYPHQLSGGMRQRAVIASALIADPELIIADEPTTALDVTIQRQVMELLQGIVESRGVAVVLITHDLAVVAETCDRVAVFYGGTIVEEATTTGLFAAPRHPYTAALLASLPRMGGTGEFRPIPGNPIRVATELACCPFAPRCANVVDLCRQRVPAEQTDGAHRFRCFRPEDPR
ncbi:ABC transporter ATP-binding protein [Micromonospora carbonacea]|uniref:Peptide/nickel transport system ATP-binding protein n=1 Tax=Micromonospora carbonacea TaxID=47853 RepID=A0A1C4V9N3_9ACTN|nr:ABC transporter ATP-binding protein [Micromonospora carbonacea]SCE80740.1 peptide/nickel transport system ATP-binding protein [Micromonospora carbonacea]